MNNTPITEHEINKGIAEILHPAEWEYWRKVDYCNNWNDLMPLVIECGIALYSTSRADEWAAYQYDYTAYQYDYYANDDAATIQVSGDNPQRALAQCLLQVLQAKAKEKSDE